MLQLFDDWEDIYAYECFFREWFFSIGGELFCEPLLPEGVSETRLLDSRLDDPEILVISIPVTLTKKHILKAVQKLLKERRDKIGFKEGGKPLSRAKYLIYTNTEIAAIEKYLKVWDMKSAGEKNAVIHEAVYGKLSDNKIRDLMAKRGEIADEAGIRHYRNQRYGSVVNQSFKKAEALIFNAALGKFPCTDMKG